MSKADIEREMDYGFDKEPRAGIGMGAPSNSEFVNEIWWKEATPEQVKDIIVYVLPVWLDLFQLKSREYGDAAFELGPRAQFVDMNRKFVKLKRALWEGEQLTTESIDEILLDLMGHCALALEMRRRDRVTGRTDN